MQECSIFPSNDGLDIVKDALSEDSKVSDGTDNERALTTSEFMTGQTS